MSDSRYAKECSRYRTKLDNFYNEVRPSFISNALRSLGYTEKDLPTLLGSNSEKLAELVEKIARMTGSAKGNMNSIWYSGVILRLLDLCEINCAVHICVALPTKVNDTNNYNFSFVNYMYVSTETEVSYHYFNGILSDENFTYFSDEIYIRHIHVDEDEEE